MQVKFKKDVWVRKLKPYWRRFQKAEDEFFKRKAVLEMIMSRKMGISLEFFSVDGEFVGIGAQEWEDRKKIPLIRFDNER